MEISDKAGNIAPVRHHAIHVCASNKHLILFPPGPGTSASMAHVKANGALTGRGRGPRSTWC
eukprot:2990131-Amphidinium_carterae.1